MKNYFQILVKFLIVVAFAAVSIMAQPPEPAEGRIFERVYLAKDDGAGKPGISATEFATTDIPIHCVVDLSNSGSVTVKMDLVVVNVNGVKPETKVVSTSYTTKDLQNQVFFNGRPHGRWIPGTYRADIYVDGNLMGKFPFTIKGTAPAVKPALNFQPKQPKQPVKSRSTTAKRT